MITDASGRAIDQASDLLEAVDGVGKDKSVDLKVIRDHNSLALSAKLTSDPVGVVDFDWFRDMVRRLEQDVPRPPTTSS